MEYKTRSWKERCFSLFLAFAMVFGMLPTVSLAADPSPTVSISRSGTGDVTFGDTETLTATISSEENLSNGTWKWTSDEDVVTITNDTSASPSIKANDTIKQDTEVTLTATYSYEYTETVDKKDENGDIVYEDDGTTPQTEEVTKEGSASKTIEITFRAAAAVVKPIITVKSNDISFEYGSEGKIEASVTNGTSGSSISYKSNDEKVVMVGSTGNLVALKTGSTTVTVSYPDATDVTVKVTVTAEVAETPDPDPEPEVTPDVEEEEEESVVVNRIYITSSSNGYSASKQTSTLSTTGTKTDTLMVNFVNDKNTVITPTSTMANAVRWTYTPSSGIVSDSSTSQETQRLFTAVGPGVATITANYEGMTAEFVITVSGITVDSTAVASGLLTYATSDVITVSTYGNVNSVVWASVNTNLLSIEVLNDTGTEAVIKTNDTTGTGYVQISGSDGSTISFPVTVTEAVVSDIIPAENINALNVLYFNTLISDFESRCQDLFPNETLVSIQGLEVPPAQGTLYIGYVDEDNTGAGVATSAVYSLTGNPSVKDIVFVPNDNYSGDTAIIKYIGRTSTDRTFYGEIHVTLAPSDDVSSSTGTNEPIGLDSYSFAQIAAKSGKTIDYVVFSIPDENRAVIYYDYKSADNYHHVLEPGEEIDKNDIDRLTVIPTGGFTGTLNIPYVIHTTDGTTLIGEVTIDVAGYDDDGPIVYNTVAGEYITLISDDFETNVQAITGYGMNYITFTLPDPSAGTLYEVYYSDTNYRKAVTENTPYYASARSPQISEVSFVPAAGFTGSLNIHFIGYDLLGTSYMGVIEINVGTQSIGDIYYICSSNSYVPFYEGDFNQFSQEQTGYNVDYIYFPNLPSSTQGTLRLGQKTYDGEMHSGIIINANQRLYLNDTPLMSQLSFDATDSYSGMVTIPFAGASVGGTEFAGTITILVTNQNLVKVPYSGTHYNPVTFDSNDFEHYSQERTGSALDYVRFELPLVENGVLYYNYESEEDYGSLVNVSTNYYVSQSHFLNSVTFVPDRYFQGTVQINFTAWGENGQSFSGVISVYVADGGDPLSYYIYTGDSIYLNSSALNDYCVDETGSSLNYITITPPSSTQGYLYQNYDAAATAHSSVGDATKLYKSQSPFIGNVAFVAKEGFIGSVTLPFTAYSTDGSTCSGAITILVRPVEANSTVYYYTGFSPIQITEEDIYDVWGSEDIDYLEIHNIPTDNQGKLYYENNLSSYATTSMKYYSKESDEGPYISKMVYAPRAGFSGTMVVSYTATTVSGRTFSGDICVVVTTGQPSLYFQDMSYHLWATASADYLYLTNVTKGTYENMFSPSDNITRGDFALMLMKAFRFTETVGSTFDDVPTDAYYANAVHSLRSLGITTGYADNTFLPQDNISRQDAMMMLSKAMDLANKGVPTANISVLNQFSDASVVATYAKSAMAAMVNGGLLSGSNGNLNPEQNMTRAEMAVVLHQAMTY